MYWLRSPLIDRLPRHATVVGAERAGGRDGNVDSLGICRIENDRVQSHAARAGLPLGTGTVPAQAREFLPALASIGRAKQRRVLHARIHRLRIGERWLDVPHALELPGMLRAVVPLMRGQRFSRLRRRVVDESIWQRRRWTRSGNRLAGQPRLMPGLAAVVRSLDQLPEPSACLGDVDPAGINR
jgi:hypothetical protein